MESLWGVDLGGTKIEIVRVAADDPILVLQRLRVPTNADKGYGHILDSIADLIKAVCHDGQIEPPRKIGVGTPGSTDPTSGLLRNSNTVCLNGRPFKRDLQKRLDCEVVTANDANCFALAEATLGSAKGARVVFGVIMGTGVGGGIVVDGKVLHGHNGIAGEWGHNVVEPDGDACYCGRRGCVETHISGPAIEREYERLTQRPLCMKEIVERHQAGSDEHASKTIRLLCERFGLCIATVINVLDPDVIVLGGGLGHVPELYTWGTQSALTHVFHEDARLRVVPPALGDSAGVFGAALLVRNGPIERL